MRLLVASLLVLGFAMTLPARADNPPPTRVGRVSLVSGKVGWQPPGGGWQDAAVNDPVASGMSLRTDAKAQGEIRIGTTTIGLAGASELDILQLDHGVMHLKLVHGRIGVELRRLGDAQKVEVDLPHGGVWLLQSGRYDIAAGIGPGPTRVTAFAGRARFVGAHLDRVVKQGASALLTGADPVTAAMQAASADAFAAWCRSRALDEAKRTLPAHFPRGVTGEAALDGHGQWAKIAGLGQVWFPDGLSADWAPYRDGHWSWVKPWGWTWIDDQPWGFAPSHYGRWALIGGKWGWAPGRPSADAVYVPAVVAFIGTPAVGISYAGGNGPAVAWFPLGPGEAYWPSYTRDLALIRRINAGSVANPAALESGPDGRAPAALVTGHFADRLFASVVPRPIFVRGQPVAPSLLNLPRARLAEAPLIMGSPRIAPPAPRSATVVAKAHAIARASERASREAAAATAVRRRLAMRPKPAKTGRLELRLQAATLSARAALRHLDKKRAEHDRVARARPEHQSVAHAQAALGHRLPLSHAAARRGRHRAEAAAHRRHRRQHLASSETPR